MRIRHLFLSGSLLALGGLAMSPALAQSGPAALSAPPALLGTALHLDQVLQAELRDRGMASALQAESFADLIRQTTRLYLAQTRDRGALIAALMSDPSVAALMEGENRADRERTVRYFVRATRREYDLPLPMAIAAVEMVSAITDRAGRLVAEGQLDIDAATDMCVGLITGGLAGLGRSLKA